LESLHLPLVLLLAALLAGAKGADTMPPSATLPNFDVYWNYDDPAATEAKFRNLLSQAEGADDPDYRHELLTQIARTEGLQRKFDEAHRTLDVVEENLADAAPVVRVRYLLERGRVFNSAGEKDKARPLFLEAFEQASEARLDFHAIDAAHMLGIIEPPDEALTWNEKALAMAEKSSDQRARNWRGSLGNNIGWTYHDAGKHEQALELFQKAVVWQREKGEAGPIRVARWTVGRALRSLQRTDEALAIQQQLLAEYEAADEKDGYVFEELGECLLLLGRDEEAKQYFTQAYAELSKDEWLKQSEAERLERLRKLGGVE
jgi:tetratricopeptide (TPR) repeat protein